MVCRKDTNREAKFSFIDNQRKGLHFAETLIIVLAQEIDVLGSLDIELAIAVNINEVVGVIA
jgi:hypothetical protein